MVECSPMTLSVPTSAAWAKGISFSNQGVRTMRCVPSSSAPNAPSTM